ncbi:flavin-containing monooxygenase [Actinophytocola sp.]|uniref:flavin-containing monooxygenase n=1 Tax=Actinophytocola sp. TaxID=1872138 RepID=UPI002ED287BB
MSDQHIETLIVGAGQAGLSTGYHLRRLNRPFLIVDGNERVGDNWRQQWDTLRLYTPAKYDGLPGLRFPGDQWEFPQKDQVADYLESYALRWDLPVRTSTRIGSLEARPGGGYAATVGADTITCDNVVVATGSFGRTPNIPDFAAELDPSVLQLHSSQYRRPSQLRPGRVLVVGASHSGTDIAYEVAPTHETVLCGRDCGQIPFRIEHRMNRVFFPVLVFVARHVLTRRTPIGRKAMEEIRLHGGPMIRVKREDLAERDVERVLSRVTGVSGGLPMLDDGRVVDVANVVWCTGFRQVLDWIKLPILREDGWPTEYRGVVETAPGLFFCGLAFQFGFSSMVLPGISRDAAYLAHLIATRTPARVAA